MPDTLLMSLADKEHNMLTLHIIFAMLPHPHLNHYPPSMLGLWVGGNSEGRSKNDNHDYSWYRGQPSVIWKGSILVSDKFDESEAEIVGHGEIAGSNGQIFTDITTLTSSLNLIEKVTASFQP